MRSTHWLPDAARRARRWIRDAGELVTPPLCEACGHRIDGGVLCSVCGTSMPRARADDLSGCDDLPLVAPFRYERETARRIMRRFKYQGARALAAPLAAEMAGAWERAGLPREDVWLVPVPASSDRLRLRGFNQAADLAQALGRTLALPVAGLARRVRPTRSQTTLAPDARERNILRAFEAGQASPHRPLVVVDDVVTTGATLRVLAGALAASGHDVIAAVAAFRTPPSHPGREGWVRSTRRISGERRPSHVS